MRNMVPDEDDEWLKPLQNNFYDDDEDKMVLRRDIPTQMTWPSSPKERCTCMCHSRKRSVESESMDSQNSSFDSQHNRSKAGISWRNSAEKQSATNSIIIIHSDNRSSEHDEKSQ